MAKKKDNTILYVGLAVAAFYLYQRWKKTQPQTKPAEKRFMPSQAMLQTAVETNAGGNLKNPLQQTIDMPEFPYVVRVKSISGLKLM